MYKNNLSPGSFVESEEGEWKWDIKPFTFKIQKGTHVKMVVVVN